MGAMSSRPGAVSEDDASLTFTSLRSSRRSGSDESEEPDNSPVVMQQPLMRAAFYSRHGAVSELKVERACPRPVPGPGQVLVRVLASAVNPVDIKLRENKMTSLKRPLPKTPGSDFAGTVLDISQCEDPLVNVGDLVFGMLPLVGTGAGSLAEYVTVCHESLALAPTRHKPPMFTEAEVASLPLCGLTVLQAFEPFVAACEAEAAAVAAAAAAAEPLGRRTSSAIDPTAVGDRDRSDREDAPDDSQSDQGTDIGYSNARNLTHPLKSALFGPGCGEPLQPTAGRSVVIQAGAGGLGCIAIQYCKHFLQMRVITTCSPRNERFLRRLGADVCIDYHRKDFLENDDRLRDVDVVFDPFSWQYRERTLQSPLPVLKPGGWYLDVASSPHRLSQSSELSLQDPLQLATPEASVSYLLFRSFDRVFSTIRGIWLRAPSVSDCKDGFGAVRRRCGQDQGTHYRLTYVKPCSRQLRTLARLAQAGIVLPVVQKKNVFAFSTQGVRDAHQAVAEAHTRGKVVVALSTTARLRGGALGAPMAAVWEQPEEGKRTG